MVEQKSPKVLCWLSGRLPHHGAAGGAPSAVCADSEVTRIVEARYLKHPLTTSSTSIMIGLHLVCSFQLLIPFSAHRISCQSFEDERQLIAWMSILRLHAIPDLQSRIWPNQ